MTAQKNMETPRNMGDAGEEVKKKTTTGDGKIAGQGTKKDTVTTLLFKTRNENFAEVFNRTVLADAPVSPGDLMDEDIKETAYLRLAKEYGGTALVQYRDVAKSVRDGRRLVILGVENQDAINYQMPFRVLELDFVNYARQIRVIEEKHNIEWRDEGGSRHVPAGITDGEYMSRFLKSDKILPCITLVLYWGEQPWDGPTRLSEMFAPSPWASLAWDLEMNILDVRRMDEKELCSYNSELRTVFGFVKYARDKDKLKHFIESNTEYFRDVSGIALNAIDELTHSPELQKIKASKYRTQGGGFDMCLGIQEMMKDSREEGREEGRKEGRVEGTVDTLRDLDYEDAQIKKAIMKKYSLSEEEAEAYL